MHEARSEETPHGRYITSDGWFVLNLADALAVRNDEKGGAVYPLESRHAPFGDFGVNVRVLRPGEPNALYHAETGQEGFMVLWGECTLVVEGSHADTTAAVDIEAELRKLLAQGLGPKDAAQRLVVLTGKPRRQLYQLALSLERAKDDD